MADTLYNLPSPKDMMVKMLPLLMMMIKMMMTMMIISSAVVLTAPPPQTHTHIHTHFSVATSVTSVFVCLLSFLCG